MTAITPTGRFRLFAVIILLVYAAGLSREISEPWIGRHDWNGAFFSQLGRNFLRYPFSLHHGMPIVAMGAKPPRPEDRSFYARHPPALVWLVGAAFLIGGETEMVARGVPILFSLASLALLMHLVDRAHGRPTALIAGTIYAVLPMSVYFGRMVDHEAVCLFFMLAAMACWERITRLSTGCNSDRRFILVWALAVAAGIWVDWAGVLFGGLFILYSAMEWRRGRISTRLCATVLIVVAFSTLLVSTYLAEYGFDGKWTAFVDMFRARTVIWKGSTWWEAFRWIPGNLTWPVMLLGLVGLASGWGWRRPPSIRNPALTLFGILSLSGTAWIMLFWRQFQIHEYWMYYLGPTAAVTAAIGLNNIITRILPRHPKRGITAQWMIVIGIGAFCIQGQNKKFKVVDFHAKGVQTFKELAAATQPDQRVVLTWNPIAFDGHGDFVFRNVIPPQLAFYMDRAFDVESDPIHVNRRIKAGDYVIDRGP